MGTIKKFISFLLVLLLLVTLVPVEAKAEDVTEDFKNPIVMTYLKSKLGKFNESEIGKLIDLINLIDENNIILDNVFDKLNDTRLYERLENKGITKKAVQDFVYDVKDYEYKGINWEKWLEDVYNSTKEQEKLNDEQIEWLKGVDEIFESIFPELNQYIIEKFKDDDYSSKFNFARFLRQVFEEILENVKVEYTNGIFRIHSYGDLEDEDEGLNSLLNQWKLQPLEESDITALKNAINDIIEAFNSVEGLDKDFVYTALKNFNMIYEQPSPPSGGSGGAGGGGATIPSEPKVNVPDDKNKPVTIAVPSEAAKIEVVDGKTTVTFDEKQVEKLLKLIDEAVAKADGREVALTIDLSDNSKVAEGATVELPVSLVAKAFEKGVAMTVNFKALGIDIPEGAFDVKGVENLKLVVEKKNAVQVPQNMRQVGNAYEISLLADEKPVSFNKKVTLRFSIKGLATNIDKLGVYYIDVKTGKTEFVGGKVDRAKSEIIAKLSHFSTYALFEYDKTFADITNHWAKAYIESMAAKRVVDGRTEDKFVPNDGITRAEFVKLMVTALELDLVPYKGSFEDVKSDAWYADYVQTAYENGIITGRVEGKVFDPNAKIMRQEIMAMVGRALGKQAIRPVDALLASFKDADKVAQYAKEHAALLVELGIVGGYPDGTLRPWENTTRAEAVKLIYGLYNNF